MITHATYEATDYGVLAAAIAVSLFGSWTFCSLAAVGRSLASTPRRWAWTVATGIAGGATIYSTHFLALLVHGGNATTNFDPFLSAAACLVGTIGFVLVAAIRQAVPGRTADVVGGLIAGGSISLTHYLAMEGPAGTVGVQYRLPMASGTIVAGTLLAIAACIHLGRAGRAGRAVPVLLVAASVLTIHFGAMAAMTRQIHGGAANAGLHGSTLIQFVSTGMAILLGLGLAHEKLAKARDAIEAERVASMAEMALEAIIVADVDGAVMDANSRARAMFDLGPPANLDAIMPGLWDLTADGSARRADLAGRSGAIPCEIHVHDALHLRRRVRTVVIRDLSERIEAERRIAHLATHDPLTDLPNRTLLTERLEQSLARDRRNGERTALLYLDLDGFKVVNDTHGHARGDAVLREVAGILRDVCRETDTVARLGGDEFAIVQSGADQPQAAEALSRRIIEAVNAAFSPERSDAAIGMSIGVAVSSSGEDGPDRLLNDADVALYRAKADGRGVWRFHEPEMDREVRSRRRLKEELRRAIPAGQMSLAYQPQFDLGTGEVTGFEALARWHHPDMGDVPPATFIAAAEASGFMLTLGAWLIEEACAEAAGWRSDLHVAVNLSALQLAQRALPARIAEILARTGLHPSRLELEIPEAWLASDPRLVGDRLEALRALGVVVAVGDFGAGRALPAVRGMPFDKVKIGRAALGDLADDGRAAAVLRALVALGRGLDLSVVAEGVETQAHLDMVARNERVGIQGHLVGRPAPIEAFRHIVDPNRDGGDAANDPGESAAA